MFLNLLVRVSSCDILSGVWPIFGNNEASGTNCNAIWSATWDISEWDLGCWELPTPPLEIIESKSLLGYRL